jgi:hypothetical protein
MKMKRDDHGMVMGWSWDGEKLTSLCPIFATIFAVLAL